MLGTSRKACFYSFIGIPARSSKRISAEFFRVVPSNSQELRIKSRISTFASVNTAMHPSSFLKAVGSRHGVRPAYQCTKEARRRGVNTMFIPFQCWDPFHVNQQSCKFLKQQLDVSIWVLWLQIKAIVARTWTSRPSFKGFCSFVNVLLKPSTRRSECQQCCQNKPLSLLIKIRWTMFRWLLVV